MTSVGRAFTPPERPMRPKASSGIQWLIGIFNNLSVQIKASVASFLLLICLLTLGTNAYLTSTRSAAGLRILTNELIPKQRAFSQVSEAVVATHMKIFRYVSWASNGVSDMLLKPLYAEINSDLDTISNRIAALAQRPDLSSLERIAMQGLLAKWRLTKNQAKDTIDVGQSDAPMATMMLGQTDDTFKAVDVDLQDMSAAISYTASNMSTQLYSDAEWTESIVIIITLAALVFSTFVAVVVGQSIVRPIKSITDGMQRLSAGETNVEIGYRERYDEIGRMVDAIEIFRRNIIERHAMELRALGEVSQTVNSTLDLEAVLSAIVRGNPAFRDRGGHHLRVREARREYQLRATYGDDGIIDRGSQRSTRRNLQSTSRSPSSSANRCRRPKLGRRAAFGGPRYHAAGRLSRASRCAAARCRPHSGCAGGASGRTGRMAVSSPAAADIRELKQRYPERPTWFSEIEEKARDAAQEASQHEVAAFSPICRTNCARRSMRSSA